MELIKKIKDAETKAQQIIAQAKKDTADSAEQWGQQKCQSLEQAEQERRKTIDKAVLDAQKQGQADIEQLKKTAENQRQELKKTTVAKIDSSVDKVVNYVKG